MAKQETKIPDDVSLHIKPAYRGRGVELILKSRTDYQAEEKVSGFFRDERHTWLLAPLGAVSVASVMFGAMFTMFATLSVGPMSLTSIAAVTGYIALASASVWGLLWFQTRPGGRLDLNHIVARVKRKMLNDYRKHCARQVEVANAISQNERLRDE